MRPVEGVTNEDFGRRIPRRPIILFLLQIHSSRSLIIRHLTHITHLLIIILRAIPILGLSPTIQRILRILGSRIALHVFPYLPRVVVR